MYYWADEGRPFMKKLGYLSFSRIYFIIIWRLHMQLRKWTKSSSWPSSRFWLHGCDIRELKCGGQYIYVSNLPPPHPWFVHTYFHSSFWQFAQANCPNFFQELFSQIECDVELIISVRQELGGHSSPRGILTLGFLHTVSQGCPSRSHLLPSSQKSTVFSFASNWVKCGSYSWVGNIPLIYYNFFPFSSQQGIIIFIVILPSWEVSS